MGSKSTSIKWPYELKYDLETSIDADVLIIGGGIAGCHAAIEAARSGVSVTVVDKAPIIRSGNGGTGVDHWHSAFTNPCSKITPDEMADIFFKCRPPLAGSEFGSLPSFYITARESYDVLLDVEKMGMVIRDLGDEFKGAAFRDDETKLMFAYDYKNKYSIRIPGGQIKIPLYREMKKLGVRMVEHTMITSLLTDTEQQGKRVVGATGLSIRTGEFFVFRAKSTLLCAGLANRLWVTGGDFTGAQDSTADPNGGDGIALAWDAGAEFASMEATVPTSGPLRYPSYSTGNAHNSWYGCQLVDNEGKEIPWVDRDGKPLKSFMDRFYPCEDQRLFIFDEGERYYALSGARPIADLDKRINDGEFKLPLYADLSAMPELERKSIWRLMLANEGRTRIPVHQNYTEAGFDPEKDLLQVNMLPADAYAAYKPYANGLGSPQWREHNVRSGGGVIYDWDLQTNIDGLFVAGQYMVGGTNHSHAACTGRYAGRHAAARAKKMTGFPELCLFQKNAEKDRVYAPVKNTGGYHWKELRQALNRIMREYCSVSLCADVLNMGLYWLRELKENEVNRISASNPHELARSLEWVSRITAGEVIMHSSLARKTNSSVLGFYRLDAEPDSPAPEDDVYSVVFKGDDGIVSSRKLSPLFYFKPPYAPTCRENYEAHCLL